MSSGGSLTHQALLYRSEEEYLAGTVAFIRDGLEHGDPIRIATSDRNAGWLRAALGAEAHWVIFDDRSQCYRHPARALAAVHRTVQAASRAGQRLRLIGEPVCTSRTTPQSTEWARYEALVNVALAWSHAVLVCAYDTRVVDPDAVTDVSQTHPELVINGCARASLSYLDPAVFNTECDRSPLPELPVPILSLKLDGVSQLATLRDFVISHATERAAALPDVEQFVQAVNAVATSAIEYGDGSSVARVWTGSQLMGCEVCDTGAGLSDPLAGRLPFGHCTVRGRRLWLARQLCDLVELRSGPAGTTVRLQLTLP